MFCKNCGAEMFDGCVRCSQCGKDPNIDFGTEIKREQAVDQSETKHKSRVLAGVLQIIFPFFAAGRLYLGNFYIALLQIFMAITIRFPIPFTRIILPIGVLFVMYDGVRILTGKVNHDADGVRLK